MFTLSSSVWPSTSISPFASMLPTNVVTPEMFTLSNSVCPSTSISPFTSTAPVNVDAADTTMSSNAASPSTSKLRTLRVLLLNVKFALFSNEPLVPA